MRKVDLSNRVQITLPKPVITLLLASAVIYVTTLLGGTAVTDAAKAGAGTVVGAAGIHAAPTVRNPAITVQPKGETAAPAPKAGEAKTSTSKKGFLVPPPPATPCILPPEFRFFVQPAQQHAASEQQLQQTQAQASPETHNETAARESAAQQSDQELQAADQELEAALRSSHLTVDEWTR